MAKTLANGWMEGTVQEFLDLTDAQAEAIEIRLRLAAQVRERRHRLGLSQQQLAKRLGTTQARISKAENSNASIDTLVRSLLALGASSKDIGRAIAS